MSDITSIAVANAMGRRRDAENAERQQKQSVAFAMLQSLVTGLKTAKTPKDARQSFGNFSKQIKKMTGVDVYNENDLANIERLITEENTITATLAEATAQNIGDILTGKKTFDQAMGSLNKRIDSLSDEFGRAEVDPFTTELHGRLARALERKKTFASAENQMRAALRPQTSALMHLVPQLDPLILRFEENLSALSAQAMQVSNLGGPMQGQQLEGARMAWMQRTGAKRLGLAADAAEVESLNPDQKDRALEVGEEIWAQQLESYRADISDEFYTQQLPSLIDISEAQIEELINMQVTFSNEAAGRSIFGMVDLNFDAMKGTIGALKDKYARGPGEGPGPATPGDETRMAQSLDGLRFSGLLDESGINFSKMNEEQWQHALASGKVEGALRSVKGPDGTSLAELIWDEDGNIRGGISHLMTLDHDKLATGDANTWDMARYNSAVGPDFTRYKSPDGKGYFETWLEVEERDDNSIMERAQNEGFANIVAGADPGTFRVSWHLFGGEKRLSGLTVGGEREAIEAQVTASMQALDEATREVMAGGSDDRAKGLMENLFNPQTSAIERDQAVTELAEAFGETFEEGQNMEKRVSNLRASILESATINSMPDQEVEEPGAELAGEATDKAKANTSRRIQETAELSSTKTRLSGTGMSAVGGIPEISTGAIGSVGGGS